MWTESDIVTFDDIKPMSEERKIEVRKEIQAAFAKMEELRKQNSAIFDIPEKYVRSHMREVNNRIEFVLRCLIPQPIKGEITTAKCRWRGLKLFYVSDYGSPISLRNKIITSLGTKHRPFFSINLDFQDETLVLYKHYQLYGTIESFMSKVAEAKE